MQQGSQEWLDFRKSKIGSSDGPVIMGVSPFRTRYDLLLEKRGEREPIAPNKFITDKGHFLEDIARLDLEEFTGKFWKPEVFVSEENERLISSVDGYCEKDGLIWECKYAGLDKIKSFNFEFSTLREAVSEQYYPQVIHHCLVTGARKITFTMVADHKVLKSLGSGELKFFHKDFILQLEDINYMHHEYLPEIKNFIELVDSEEPPTPTKKDAINIQDSRLEQLISLYATVNEDEKENNEKKDRLKKSIFEIAGNYHDKVRTSNGLVSVSESAPKEFIDYELLIKENPDVLKSIDLTKYKRICNPRVTKRITISKGK